MKDIEVDDLEDDELNAVPTFDISNTDIAPYQTEAPMIIKSNLASKKSTPTV